MDSAPSNFDPDRLLDDTEWVCRLAFRLTRSHADAEDLSQQTFLEILDRQPEGVQRWRPWVAGTMRNLERSRYNRDIRREHRERKAEVYCAEQTPDDQLAEDEIKRMLAQAAGSLPEPYRAVVLFRYYDGISSAEIARNLGVPSATVRSRLKRGIGLLERDLSKRIGSNWQASCLAIIPVGGLWSGNGLDSGPPRAGKSLAVNHLLAGAALVVVGVVGGLVLWGPPILHKDPDQIDVIAGGPIESEVVTDVGGEFDSVVRTENVILASVDLTVIDAVTGLPIEEARAVSVRDANWESVTGQVVGDLSIQLPDGKATNLTVSAAGYLTRTIRIDPADYRAVAVQLRSSAAISLRILERETHVEAAGKLKAIAWPSDRAVPDFETLASERGVVVGTADENGKIVLDGLEPETRYNLLVAGGGLMVRDGMLGLIPNSEERIVSVRRVFGVHLVPEVGRDRVPAVLSDMSRLNSSTSWSTDFGNDETLHFESPLFQFLRWTSQSMMPREARRDLTYICTRPVGSPAVSVHFDLRLPGHQVRSGIAPVGPVLDGVPEYFVDVSPTSESFGAAEVVLTGLLETAPLRSSEGWQAAVVFTGADETGNAVELFYVIDGFTEPRCRLENVPAGTYVASLHLTAIAPGWASMLGSAGSSPVIIGENSPARVVFDLSGFGAVRIEPSGLGRDYSGRLAISIRRKGAPGQSRLSWARSPYLIPALPPGDYEIGFLDTLRLSDSTGEVERRKAVVVADAVTVVDVPLSVVIAK